MKIKKLHFLNVFINDIDLHTTLGQLNRTVTKILVVLGVR